MSAASTARERDSSANMRPNTAAPGRVTARSQTDCSPTIDMQGAALTSPPSRWRIRVGHGRAAANAWLAPDMARSIGRRLRILDDTVLSDKSGERRGIVGKENLVEAAQHFACLALPGFAGRGHGRAHDRAPCVRPAWARR